MIEPEVERAGKVQASEMVVDWPTAKRHDQVRQCSDEEALAGHPVRGALHEEPLATTTTAPSSETVRPAVCQDLGTSLHEGGFSPAPATPLWSGGVFESSVEIGCGRNGPQYERAQ